MQQIQCCLLILAIISTFATIRSATEDNLVQSIWRPCGSKTTSYFTFSTEILRIFTFVNRWTPNSSIGWRCSSFCASLSASERHWISVYTTQRPTSSNDHQVQYVHRLLITTFSMTSFWTFSIEATQSVPSLERIIVARVPAAFDKKVEMPYGPAISPCVNSSMVATDGSECLSEGVEAGKNYTYTSFFDVLRSFPTVSTIYIIY